tara:strand:- start:328 stop:1260 length:933 start_codon:yes stop_codon:yes gene_type:complete
MKRILILGGCGYVGSKLYRFLQNKYNVDTIDLEWYGNFINDNNQKQDISNLQKESLAKYDSIVLLAAHSSVKMCENNMISVLKNNVLNFIKLLSLVEKHQKFIYASSSSVYGDTKKDIVNEEYSNFEPNNYYDLSKHEIDSYAKLSDRTYFGLRFGTVNGASPNLRNDIMINAMTYNAMKNGKVFCFNPEIHRPILGIKDLCRAVETIIEKGSYENRGIYNLASFNSTAKEISVKVAKTLNADLEIVEKLPETITNVKLQTKAYNFCINSEKFTDTFDFKFKESVESIVSSIKEEYDNINMDNRSNAKIY